MLGKETIDLWNNSETFSQSRSTGVNYNKTGRELKNIYELNTMDRDKCIVRVSGLPPFFSNKFDPKTHPNYKYTADYDERNTFDFKKYRRKMKEKESVKIRFHKNDQYKIVL